MTKIEAVPLDIDGTLVDSNDAHARAWLDALAEFGLQAEFEAVRCRIGMGGDKLLPEVTGVEEESELGQRISERRSEIFRSRYLPELEPFPGAKELLQRMNDRGLRLVVATSAKKEELKGLLRVLEAEHLLDGQTSSDDAEESKPDPDIVAAALEQARCAPERVLMLGDTPYDAEAAARAGVGLVGFRCGGWTDERLQPSVGVYDGPQDLLERYADSPLA